MTLFGGIGLNENMQIFRLFQTLYSLDQPKSTCFCCKVNDLASEQSGIHVMTAEWVSAGRLTYSGCVRSLKDGAL